MKNKFLFVSLFAIVLAIGVMCFNGVNDDVVYANDDTVTEATPQGVDYIVEYHTKIDAYRTKVDGYYKSPSSQTTSTGEWVFAGWYTKADCSETMKKSKTSGEGYAKFVSADVLSVKCQISTDTQLASPSTLLRCISSVDTLKYSKVGFDLITPSETKNMEGSTVGTRIQVAEDKKSNPCNYSPKVVDTESEYFYSAIETINGEDFAKGFLVKPYWITKDGTKVYGVSKYVVIADALNKSAIYIPVKKSTEPTGGATFTVEGNSADYMKYDADGGYAHLKYSVDSTTLGSVTKFQVTGGDSDTVYYRNLNTKYTGSNADESWYTAYADTTEDEYVIATSADLYGLSVMTSDSTNKMPLTGKTIYLCADIEANKGQVNGSAWSGETSYTLTPIATGTPFDGVFDGQGHTISGIYVNPTSNNHGTGLFRWTASNSTIRNFTLSNSLILGSKYYNGSVVGRAGGKISNVTSDATIVGSSPYTGGIAGYLYSDSILTIQIENCTFNGSVTGTTFTGGIAGGFGATDIKVTGCTVTNQISGGQATGGILGGKDYSLEQEETYDVENCKFSGELNATADYIGGIVGITHLGTTNIKNCQFNGKVATSTESVGGIVGYAYAGTTAIQNCTSSDNATVKNTSSNYAHYAGGIVGTIKGYVTISNSSYTGKFDAQQKIGGIAGRITGSAAIEDSYFDGEFTATKGYSGGLVGYIVSSGTINLTNCYAKGNVNSTGGDNVGGIVGCVDSGTINIDGSYFNGTLSSQGAYVGGILGQIKSTGTSKITKSYVTGTMNAVNPNGDNEAYAGGIVGCVTSGPINIDSSYFDGSLVAGIHYVGGIIGYMASTDDINIKKCYVEGLVKSNGGNNVGGIIGVIIYTDATITMEDCLNKAQVQSEGGNWLGGLIGRIFNQAPTINMTRCLNMGHVTGKGRVGSIVGQRYSDTINVVNVYDIKSSTATNTTYSNNVMVGNNGNDIDGVQKINLTDITVSNEVNADTIRSTTLSGLFGTDTIWTIDTEVGSTPELKLK